MNYWPLFVLASALVAPQAQEGRSVESRLDQETVAALRPIFEAARRDSVPVRALEDKALEGAAKRVPSARIVAAVERLATELRETRSLLRAAATSTPLSEGEIIAAADVRSRGVAAEEIAALRHNAPPSTNLEIPFAVLGALVQRGVPADEARTVVEHLVTSGVSQEKIVEIPARVDAALRVGAPPVPALGSALAGLGIPAPPVTPPTPPGKPRL